MRSPNLNALRVFDAAARNLNFRLAAEDLNVTQGAVAQQVRRLETELGVRLFHRKARGLALTEIGRSYHGPVRRALSIIDDATAKIRPATLKARTRRLTLSVTPSFAAKWLVPRLGHFAQVHPEIDLRTMASEGIADFRSDGVDLAIRQGRPPFADGFEADLLAPLDLRAVCSPAYAATSISTGRIEDFAAQPLIQDGHNLWDALFESAGIAAQGRLMHFNQTALAMDAAMNGQGVALAPRLLVEGDLARGTLVELWRDRRSDQGGYYIVCPKQSKPSVERKAVTDWIMSEVRRSRAASE